VKVSETYCVLPAHTDTRKVAKDLVEHLTDAVCYTAKWLKSSVKRLSDNSGKVLNWGFTSLQNAAKKSYLCRFATKGVRSISPLAIYQTVSKDVFSEVRRCTVCGVLSAGIMCSRMKRRSEEVGEMSIFPTKILLATDGSEEAELALRTAVALAKSTDSELHVLTAIPEQPDLDYMVHRYPFRSPDEALEAFEQGTKTILEEQVRKITEAGILVGGTHLEVGRPVDRAIVGFAEDAGVGLIVMGSRGRGGMRRALMGSVSDSVVRHAHCPVMIVRE
jgi:nucleotide-binding universal stress UspA family protein